MKHQCLMKMSFYHLIWPWSEHLPITHSLRKMLKEKCLRCSAIGQVNTDWVILATSQSRQKKKKLSHLIRLRNTLLISQTMFLIGSRLIALISRIRLSWSSIKFNVSMVQKRWGYFLHSFLLFKKTNQRNSIDVWKMLRKYYSEIVCLFHR